MLRRGSAGLKNDVLHIFCTVHSGEKSCFVPPSFPNSIGGSPCGVSGTASFFRASQHQLEEDQQDGGAGQEGKCNSCLVHHLVLGDPFPLEVPPPGLACLPLSSALSEEKAWVRGGSEELLWFHRELGLVSEGGQSGDEPDVES